MTKFLNARTLNYRYMKDFLTSKTFNIITLIIIVAAIPVTVSLTQKRQEIRQEASIKRNCIPRPICDFNDSNCGKDVPLGGWCPPEIKPTSQIPL